MISKEPSATMRHEYRDNRALVWAQYHDHIHLTPHCMPQCHDKNPPPPMISQQFELVYCTFHAEATMLDTSYNHFLSDIRK